MRKKEEMEYLKKGSNDVKALRTEIFFTPLLVFLPLFVSCFMIYEWLYRGFFFGSSSFDSELMLGVIILVGNIIFDIPFITSLRRSFSKR